ncbi:MAG TPA: M50 family metallopeptidase [Candidatus Tyrphobacter sp.]
MLLAAVTLTGFGKVVTFLVMLSVLVILHELGHFIVARRNGVHVNEFSVGMGPKIFAWKSPRTGTQYSLRALPIGGYCAMYGEDAKAGEAEQQREYREHHAPGPQPADDANFQAKTPWQRLGIIVAGPLANFILAYVILLFGALTFGVPSTNTQPVVGDVAQGSPAALHGLKPGDRIVAVNGVAISNGDELMNSIHNALGRNVTVDYLRNGLRYEFDTQPVPCSSIKSAGPIQPQIRSKGCIGFAPFPAYARVGVGAAFVASVNEYAYVADNVVGGIGLLVTHFTQYSSQISGPVGIGQAATTIQDFGPGPYLSLAATISFALGIFNLLPIPALDGGRAAFLIVEIIRGKPIDPEREGMVHLAGFAVILMILIVVTFHDISRIASGQGVF